MGYLPAAIRAWQLPDDLPRLEFCGILFAAQLKIESKLNATVAMLAAAFLPPRLRS